MLDPFLPSNCIMLRFICFFGEQAAKDHVAQRNFLNHSKSRSKTVLEHLMMITKALFGTYQFLTKLGNILATPIFPFATFEQMPNLLLKVELWGVTRQALLSSLKMCLTNSFKSSLSQRASQAE
jgi:hypothetical protein